MQLLGLVLVFFLLCFFLDFRKIRSDTALSKSGRIVYSLLLISAGVLAVIYCVTGASTGL